MNDDLPNEFERQEETGWQEPELSEEYLEEDDEPETPQMSEVGTLGSIFFEPGATFEDLRRKPRFLLASLIILVLFTAFSFMFIEKVGFEELTRARIEKGPMSQNIPAEQKEQMIKQQSTPVVKYISVAAGPIVLIISFLIGGLIYWVGTKAMGGTISFSRALSVWVYSSFPPTVVSSLANILILFLKSPDDMDILADQRGLVHANPSFFMDAKAMPVIAALVGTFDLFFIWGWILAAIGLRIVGKISSGAAWAIVLIVALLNITARVVAALFT